MRVGGGRVLAWVRLRLSAKVSALLLQLVLAFTPVLTLVVVRVRVCGFA